MMMVDDMGEGDVKNDQKSDDVICGRPLSQIFEGFFTLQDFDIHLFYTANFSITVGKDVTKH